MTIPNKIFSLTLSSSHRRMGAVYSGGALTHYKPEFTVDDLSLDAGLDQMARGEITYNAFYRSRNIAPDLDHMDINWMILPDLPHSHGMKEVAAGANSQGIMYLCAYLAQCWLNDGQDRLIDNGLQMYMTNYDPGQPDLNGEYVYYTGFMSSLMICFFNPIVNDISRFWAPTAGGVEVVLTGLGFNNSDAEIETGGNPRPGGWSDEVDEIQFIGLQGQGTTTLTGGGGDPDFTINSNTQITIPAGKFPALSAGSYSINLRKVNVALTATTHITGYAGDWNCDSDGRVYASTRITFYISDTYVDRPFRTRKAPLILTDWHLKDKTDGSEIMKYYSMDYLRCSDKVYKGNLSAMSSIPRGFESKTGLFKISDLTLDLANNDLEFSKLLAGTTILKNQIVKIYQAYPDEPFGWRSHIISLIIDDYSLEDDIFKVKMKDVTQKYFRLNVPTEVCSEGYEDADYSNIHPDSKGASVPEALGLCSLTTGEFRGQIEALCIDTVNFIYLAAKRALYSIDQVYADDRVAVDTANYSVSVEDDGRTYITFTSDQEDKKVTFNCKGYVYSGLNSTNGYVQNPAYIILYFLLMILKIPPTLIDFASFDDVAAVYDNMDEAEAGKLILQDQEDPMEFLQGLLARSKIFLGKEGRITIGKKSISNYSTNNSETAPTIFKQLEAVGKSIRKFNLRDAISFINAEFDWVPTWDLFKSNVSGEATMKIDPFDPILMEDNRTIRRSRRRGGRKTRPWAR